MDFHNFYPIYVFKDKESTADIPTELPCLSDFKIQVNFQFERYCHINFWNFQTIHVFEVRESIADISSYFVWVTLKI